MRIVLVILSLLFAAGGVLSALSIRSDIQIILAVVLFGGAITFFALATVLAQVIHLRQDIEDNGKLPRERP